MSGIKRPIHYFGQAGYENTNDLVEIVYNRMKEGERYHAIVIPNFEFFWPLFMLLRFLIKLAGY
jgi:hypothetical protein